MAEPHQSKPVEQPVKQGQALCTDKVLKRMLDTPPRPRKPKRKRAKPRQ